MNSGARSRNPEAPMAEEIEVEAGEVARPLGRHIRKRALKNKALSVAFNEKDLRYYI